MSPLAAIRLAMLGGLLLFGAVTWFLQRSPDWRPTPGIDTRTVTLAARTFWVLALTGSAVLFRKTRRPATASRANTVAIGAWALGESVALFGAVVYFLTGASGWYVAGLLFLVATFLAFPGRRLA